MPCRSGPCMRFDEPVVHRHKHTHIQKHTQAGTRARTKQAENATEGLGVCGSTEIIIIAITRPKDRADVEKRAKRSALSEASCV